MVVRHDNSGLFAAWHLREISVFSPAAAKTAHFVCDDWLQPGPGGDLSGCRRELAAAAGPAPAKAIYKVVTHTGNQHGAGTDSNVYISIIGDKGTSGERLLDNSSNNFERNKVGAAQAAGTGRRRRHSAPRRRRLCSWSTWLLLELIECTFARAPNLVLSSHLDPAAATAVKTLTPTTRRDEKPVQTTT